MQNPRLLVVLRRCAETLTVVLFVLWVMMAFARPRHEVAPRHYHAVSATCTDVAVLPFRHEREVVLCSHLGSARHNPVAFTTLSLSMVGSLIMSIFCRRKRTRNAAAQAG